MKYILWTATILIILNYLFWEKLEPLFGFEFFEPVQALFILLLCFYIFLSNRKLFISFFLLCCSINNFVDEVSGNWNEFYLSEIIIAILFIPLWLYKTQKYVRKNTIRRIFAELYKVHHSRFNRSRNKNRNSNEK